jgi:NADPH-dependent 7-cyano-7-deazaguanine reductase QueF
MIVTKLAIATTLFPVINLKLSSFVFISFSCAITGAPDFFCAEIMYR